MMRQCKGIFFQLTGPKVKALIFVYALQTISMMLIGLRFGKTNLGKDLLLVIPVFAILLFTIQILVENEKIFTRNIWRSIPIQNHKLYLVNLLTSILTVVIYVALQPVLLQGILKLELDSLMKVIDISDGAFFLDLSPQKVALGILNVTDFFAMISLVHLGSLTMKNIFPKLGAGLMKFISYVLVFGILTAISFGFQWLAVKFVYHNLEALGNSGLYTIFLIVLEVGAGIYLMRFAETEEN